MNVQEIAKEALIRKFEKMSIDELIQYVEKRDIMSKHSTAVTQDYWATVPTITCEPLPNEMTQITCKPNTSNTTAQG